MHSVETVTVNGCCTLQLVPPLEVAASDPQRRRPEKTCFPRPQPRATGDGNLPLAMPTELPGLITHWQPGNAKGLRNP